MNRKALRLLAAGAAIVAFTLSTPSFAQQAGETQTDLILKLQAQLQQSQAQLQSMQQQINALIQAQAQDKVQVNQAVEQSSRAASQVGQVQAQVAATAKANAAKLDANGHGFFEHKQGPGVTFYVPKGELAVYGNIDVSVDYVTKNVGSPPANYAPSPPVGNFGWMPALSTNLSYIGVRGFEEISPNSPFKLVYQFEAGFDVTATPGLKETNNAESNTVNGTLFNRNTYIGFASAEYGAIKIGKTYAPYKSSTDALNPFGAQLGDYASIMGNTGGDSRVEFGTRLDHSIWYESPVWNGMAVNLLFSPGQNRDDASGDLAAGESDCTGGNIPESGADLPALCNDGAWSNAVSGAASYTHGPLYVTVAGEWHERVNRQSDITGMFGATSAVLPDAYSQQLYNDDVANEWATKVAAKYTFPTGTTVGAIGEYMHRDEAKDLMFQNERTRFGTWAFASQALTAADTLSIGWAHAFRTPGDPGQHNNAVIPTIDNLGTYASNHNQADMVTIALKHFLTRNLSVYGDAAFIDNGPSAHYALGAGGRGIATDCHDASDATGGADSDPHCYTGQKILGVSAGIKQTF